MSDEKSNGNGGGLVWRLLTLLTLALAMIAITRAELFVTELQKSRTDRLHVEASIQGLQTRVQQLQNVQPKLITWVNEHHAAAVKAEQVEAERQAHLLAVEAAKEELRREALARAQADLIDKALEPEPEED